MQSRREAGTQESRSTKLETLQTPAASGPIKETEAQRGHTNGEAWGQDLAPGPTCSSGTFSAQF